MKRDFTPLTTAQFAKLHNVNKRTLHYYDTIQLFSPNSKGDNGYRYYDLSQSMDFEYIRMLKELNMSIEEIMDYMKNPSPEKFMQLADVKEQEINTQIKKLNSMKKIIQTRKHQLELCRGLKESRIEVVFCRQENLLVLPYDFSDDDITRAFSYIAGTWSMEQVRMGVGGIISASKILKNDFSTYDGIYTPALNSAPAKDLVHKPQGTYLCCYHKGTWDTLPCAYGKIVSYAEKNRLKLTGYAYEMGLNEFAISKEEDYITRIMIQIEEIPGDAP